MANFDEHHPDVAKINPGDYYDPNISEWTMEMEKAILEFLICQKEGVERGAKKAYLCLSLGQIAELLWKRFRIVPPQILLRIEEMEMRYDWWKELLASDGVFKNAERGLVCIDTAIVKTLTDEVTFLYGEEIASRSEILESREISVPHIWSFRTQEEARYHWQKLFGHLDNDE
ncbi:hypothetical protein CASFOL_016151 [Castilleja foliolosa]|uniref:Uncharacterized protein n=1 Tax=Castilleja foliolosa TaxID=1961234 RepID=A0ABD3DG42_9LAMI